MRLVVMSSFFLRKKNVEKVDSSRKWEFFIFFILEEKWLAQTNVEKLGNTRKNFFFLSFIKIFSHFENWWWIDSTPDSRRGALHNLLRSSRISFHIFFLFYDSILKMRKFSKENQGILSSFFSVLFYLKNMLYVKERKMEAKLRRISWGFSDFNYSTSLSKMFYSSFQRWNVFSCSYFVTFSLNNSTWREEIQVTAIFTFFCLRWGIFLLIWQFSFSFYLH